ncbi:hypothetical protein [Aminobacter niigataensis]|uniref:hypothetical protein n=1 Tax=Aminobacter niigataensis TaxID=83265 RepID=UPI00384D9B33
MSLSGSCVSSLDTERGRADPHARRKFSAIIIRKVSEHVALDPTAKLTFEASDGIAPMQLHQASMPLVQEGDVHVQLSARGGELQAARPLAGRTG